MSQRVLILIVSWLCIFSVSEATLGASCNETGDCTVTVEICTGGNCDCSSGYFNVSDVCVSSSITVSLTQSSSVVYGSEVILTATITSEVPLNPIKWQKVSSGGTPTDLSITPPKYTQSDVGSGLVKLTIKNVTFTDSGNYQVEVSNAAEKTNTSNQVLLTVTGERPTATIPGTISESGTTVTIDCTVSVSQDSPAVTSVYWLLNGKTLDISNNAKYSGGIVGNPSLSIKNIASTDAGVYHCGATNLVESSSSSLSVTLAAPSVETILHPAGPVNHSSNVTFTGSYTSFLSVTNIKWQKLTGSNFIDIDITADKYTGSSVTGTSPKLVINSVQFTDETSYRLVVTNGVGSTPKNISSLNVIGGGLTVTTGENVTGRFGGSTTIGCTVTGPEVNNIQWIKYIKNAPVNITIGGGKYSGASVDTMALTIHSLNNDDAECQYQCTASNPRGFYPSANRASVQVKKGQFSENCTDFEICHAAKFVTCTKNKCLCMITYYHKDQVCYQKTGLVPTNIRLNSTTTTFSVYWSPPNTHRELVSKYEVKWRINGSSSSTSGPLNIETVNNFTVSSDLIPGQLYLVRVISHADLTNPQMTIYVHSADTSVIIEQPNPPTNLQCPQSPLDVSLEISWTAPAEPNGRIFRYQINVSPGNVQLYTSSNETHKNVEGLSPEQLYTFTVRTINDALDSTSEPSQQLNCATKAGVSTAPTNFDIDEIQSRGLRINFNRPDNVNGILAAYKIVISERGNCVQQILVYGHCYTCMSTFGCQPPINYTIPDITNNDVSYTASGLNPYTQYMVKVVAINGVGEGHPVKKTIRTDEEVPLQPGQITASSIQFSSLTLAWTLSDPSPGNTTYAIYTYEGTDDVGTDFLMKESTKVYGFHSKTLRVTGLEEYWPYKFKVTAATVKGDNKSNFSSVFRTEQAAPGKVLNLTIQRKGNDYKAAYVSWNPPALRDHNGVLKSYLFSDNHTGTMKEEEIFVLLHATEEKKISVVPEAVYIIKVVLQNNESLESPASMQTYEAPTGPPPVTNIEPVTTKHGQHIFTENTITIEINTAYFKNNENGKQVFFGIAVCAKSKCKDKTNMAEITLQQDWKDLPNWHKASRDGFPLYRVTNGTFMHNVREGDLRRKRSTTKESVIEFKIGEDATCFRFNANFYCNGPLSAGTSYIVIIFACTNGGCTYYQTTEPFVTKLVIKDETTGMASIIGSVVAVTLVVAVVVIGILLWKRNRRHKECKKQTNTYADLNLDERTKVDQPYSLLEHGSRAVKNKSVSLNAFYDHVVDLLRNNRQKLTKEYHDLLQYTERAASTVASSKSNVSKNRGNIIPYDFNRVKLCSPGASDYIDASFLLDKCYILTCYPIAKTFWTFWQMVWEQSVSTIVVITEQSDARESWYFSDNEGTLRTIERIDVELLAKFKSSENVTMRKIKISKDEGLSFRQLKVVLRVHLYL